MALRPPVGTSDRLAVALLVLLTVPFLGAAHKIDDPLYLRMARHVLAHPLDPFGGPSFWHERPATFLLDLYNPPVIAYLLALPVALGGREITVHAFMLAIGVAALLACSWAGASWGVPRSYTLLLAASPAVCVSAVGAMTDLPFLLFCALAWGLAGRGRGASAGVAVATSALTKYAGLLNLPLALLALRRPWRRGIVAAAVAATIFGAYSAWNVATYGVWHFRAAGRFQALGLAHQSELAASFVASLGLVGLPALLGLLQWSRGLVVVALASAITGAVLLRRRARLAAARADGFRIRRRPAGGGGGGHPACGRSLPALRVLGVRPLYVRRRSTSAPRVTSCPRCLRCCGSSCAGASSAKTSLARALLTSVAASSVLAVVFLRADTADANLWRDAAARAARRRPRIPDRTVGIRLVRERARLPSRSLRASGCGKAMSSPSRRKSTPSRPRPPRRPSSCRDPSLLSRRRGCASWTRRRAPATTAAAGACCPSDGAREATSASRSQRPIRTSSPRSTIRARVRSSWTWERRKRLTCSSTAGPRPRSSRARTGSGTRTCGRSGPTRRSGFPCPPMSAAWPCASVPGAVGGRSPARPDRRRRARRRRPGRGWRSYAVPIEGRVAGGVTDIVLQPAGHERPGPPDRGPSGAVDCRRRPDLRGGRRHAEPRPVARARRNGPAAALRFAAVRALDHTLRRGV